MTEKVEKAIPLLPHSPGVYLMKNKDDKVIYVGKAINLYNRVSQYFLRPQVGKVAKMVENVDHFETILTKTDKEAFLLEENLIHTYYPRYNILLKDGKHYPYIALKKKGDPYLKIARSNNDKRSEYYYFGPFSTSSYAYEVINLLNKLFPTRKCRTIPKTPCLYYHMGMCLGPCINKIDPQKYDELYNKIRDFLNGDTQEIKAKLKLEMEEYSNNLEFEKAGEIAKTLKAIEHITSFQGVEDKNRVSRDVFAYTSRNGYLSLALLTYRRGILLGKETFILEEFGDNIEQITNAILHYYSTHDLPHEILINIPNIKEQIESIYDVRVNSITKGDQLELIEMASLNAKNALDSHFVSARLEDDKVALLEDLGHIINIPTPYRVELFDNSHIQGDSPVGVAVVFINGEPVKKLYRKYNIEHMEKRDDFASMKEVMLRRYKRMKEEEQDMPDLILVDGGLTQIHAGNEIINELGLNIPVYGLYKNDKHQTKGIMDKEGNTYPIDNKSLFFMLVRMQDEVHRFAISFHHDKRSKSFTKGILDDVKGLGSKRQEIIRLRYPSLDLLKSASLEELSQLIPEDVAKNLLERIKAVEKDRK